MPCIIDNSKSEGKNGNIWKSYCGKTLYFSSKPFRSTQEALNSSDSICPKCRNILSIPKHEKHDTISYDDESQQIVLTFKKSEEKRVDVQKKCHTDIEIYNYSIEVNLSNENFAVDTIKAIKKLLSELSQDYHDLKTINARLTIKHKIALDKAIDELEGNLLYPLEYVNQLKDLADRMKYFDRFLKKDQ